MNQLERKKLEKEMLFEEGFDHIQKELADCALFDDYIIGHVNHAMRDSMLDALETIEESELIEALVNICIKAMNHKPEPTTTEVLRKLFSLEEEVNTLRIQNKKLSDQVAIKTAALESLETTNKQRALVQQGQKISYNEEIQPGAVMDLLRKGMSISKIAEHFGVSRNLIYRRIKELKEAGVDVDALRKKK